MISRLLPVGLLLCASAAQAQFTLESLPRPATPPPEVGPVVPARVLRWRQEATAYEHGDGVPRDAVLAAQLYCRAARYGDAEAQYALAWMLTNERGIARDEATAAHLFAAAAEQGHEQARNMAERMGTPLGPPPPCLHPPDSDPMPVAHSTLKTPNAIGAPEPPPPAGAPEVIVKYVRLTAPEFKLSPSLVLAVMARESGFDPLAVSPKNAQGLMQLLPATGVRFGVRKLTDPVQNIRAGMAYLRWLLAYFQGDLTLALAGYNAGEGAVDRYRGVPPYAETRAYVWNIVASLQGRMLHPYDPAVTLPSPMLAVRPPAGPGRK